MSSPRVMLFAVGCFNPITIMHLRMFELARDYLHRRGCSVVGGIISPVSDAYPKQDLAEGRHRVEMARLATQNTNWIKVSSWEVSDENNWTRTCISLQHHQKELDEYLKGSGLDKPEWVPETVKPDEAKLPIRIRMLCGADVLETFNRPGLWADEHVIEIVRDFGLAVITRSGEDPQVSIMRNSILSNHKSNIFIIEEKVGNEISSTKIRAALRAGESIKYLVPDPVIKYITEHSNLYRP